jgi:Predicted membrane protein
MNFDFKNFFSRLYAKFFDDNIMSHSAQVAFYLSFSLFPLLIFLISLFGMVLTSADELRAELFMYMKRVMPVSAYTLVETTLQEVMQTSTGGKLTFGFLIALWSASAAFDSLRTSLNAVYNLEEVRPWWKTKLFSLAMTFGIGLLVLLALSLIFYGSQMLAWLLPIETPWLLQILGIVIVLSVLVLAFALVYNFLPNHSPMRWKWITPGAVVGIILWLLFSAAFRVYLQYFDNYAKTYGSLGAVIVLMLWLYLTALVILIGGAINAIFDEESGVVREHLDTEQIEEEKETEKKPLGEAVQKRN